ncbi:MAG: 6-phosphogluconolactonase [Actinobacteria bacterium]|nr:6-phosphogluconolactonase [Actinomycetota bacterium]
MPIPGEVRIVPHVPAAFAELVTTEAPRSMALSGGDTARACYQLLATAARVDWSRVEVFFGDERWVPVHDHDSNEGMARLAFLDEVDPAWVHSMHGAGPTPEAAAAAYDALVGAAAPIDLVHLGLGPDGHTASLFPASTALDVTDRLVVVNADDAHPHTRLTFTYPALARSRLVVFTVAGAGKRDAFARIRAGEDLPAARVEAERVIWLVDPEAMG